MGDNIVTGGQDSGSRLLQRIYLNPLTLQLPSSPIK